MKKNYLFFFNLLLLMAVAVPQAWADGNYDFVYTQPDAIGNKLYMKIMADGESVLVVGPAGSGYDRWVGFQKPVGEVYIPATVSNEGTEYTVYGIGNNAFSGCKGITGIILPEGLKVIRNTAFQGCTSMSNFVMNSELDSIGDNAFQYAPITGMLFLTNSNLKYVGRYAFAGTHLSFVGVDVKTVREYSFSNCEYLSMLAFGDNVEAIEQSAFAGCIRLYRVTIPNGLTSIGAKAFDNAMNVNTQRDISYYAGYPYGSRSMNGEYSETDSIVYDQDHKVIRAVHPDKYGRYDVPSSIDEIGPRAFWGCDKLTDVTIMAGVSSIGQYAFGECRNLKGVTFNSGYLKMVPAYCFYRCHSLKSVFFGNNVQLDSICSYAFTQTGFPGTLRIPANTMGIQTKAFDGVRCIEYTGHATYASNDTYWGADLMNVYEEDSIYYETEDKEIIVGCHRDVRHVVVPNTVLEIAEGAFSDCAVETVEIPESVEYIGAEAFAYCYNLRSVVLLANISKVPDYCFVECSELREVELGGNIHEIGEGAFQYCNLEEIALPEGLQTIGDYAFFDCGPMVITVPEGVEEIGEGAFTDIPCLMYDGGAQWEPGDENWGAYTLNGFLDNGIIYASPEMKYVVAASHELEDVGLPTTVEEVGPRAFYGCTNLRNIGLPEGLLTIGDFAFDGCYMLEEIEMPSTVQTIGRYAFCNCRGPEYISIPSSVTSIGENAFRNVNLIKNRSSQTSADRWGAVLMDSEGYYADGVYYRDNSQTVAVGVRSTMDEVTFSENVEVITDGALAIMPEVEQIVFEGYRVPEYVFGQGFEPFYLVNEGADIVVPCNAVATYRFVNPFSQVADRVDGIMEYDLNIEETIGGEVELVSEPSCDNATLRLYAVAYDGYTFWIWSDGVTENPRDFDLSEDPNVDIAAEFVATTGPDEPPVSCECEEGDDDCPCDPEGISSIAAEGITISSMERTIVVGGLTTQHVSVYDMMGRQLSTTQSGNRLTATATARGIYFVHIDGHRAQKVVIAR